MTKNVMLAFISISFFLSTSAVYSQSYGGNTGQEELTKKEKKKNDIKKEGIKKTDKVEKK